MMMMMMIMMKDEKNNNMLMRVMLVHGCGEDDDMTSIGNVVRVPKTLGYNQGGRRPFILAV